MKLKINVTEKEILSMPNDATLGEYIRKRYWDMLEKKMSGEDVEYDECVICGKQTPYTKNTPIDVRVGYVEGAGQTCCSPDNCKIY